MNSFGRIFRVSLFGESHGSGIGLVLDACPAGLPLQAADFLPDLARRKPGAPGTTARREPDEVRFLSGVFEGHTTGAPVTIFFENTDARSADYEAFLRQPRPGHADWTAAKKFGGYNDYRGSGHFSGRVTVALVAAGVIAKKLLPGASVSARLVEAGGSTDIAAAVESAIAARDSIGGVVECRVLQLPPGLGEPFFDSIESLISHAVFAIPGIRGVEFGSGFAAAGMTGSVHNDALVDATGTTASNHHGGINGGISNGNELLFRVAVKPTASIGQAQRSFNLASGQVDQLLIPGRHDVCFALRVPVLVEAVTALVLADLFLINQAAQALAVKNSIGPTSYSGPFSWEEAPCT
jgi:chorismate synthase